MKKTTKKMRKWLSMLLAVILTVGIIPANVIAEDGQTLDMTLPPDENSIAPTGTADASSGLVEDESRRDAFTKHYVDEDGTYYAVVFSEQVHYEDNGRWKEVDNTLSYDSANKKYTAAGDRFGVGFADKASANELVSISDGEHTLSWTISFADAGVQRAATGTEKVTAADVSVQLAKRADNANGIKTKENIGRMGKAVSGVRYNGVFKNSVDLRYSVLHGKIEEDVILNSPEGFSSYMLTVNTGGLTVIKQSDNSVAFVNTQGEAIFTIGAPWMKDANAAVSSNIEVVVMQKGNTAYISYTPDSQWLNADERAYPVLIDPSFTTRYYTSNYEDTYVWGGDTSASAARATEETMKVGNYQGSTCDAFIKILNIPDFEDDLAILDASFDIWTYGTATPALTLSEIVGTWSPDTITVANQPGAGIIVSGVTGTVNEDNVKYSFDITDWMNDIFYTYGYINSYFNGLSWDGFKISYTTEILNNYLEILSSENMDYADCRPTMTIQYINCPFDGIEDGAIYSFQNASSNKYLTVYNGNTANNTNVIQSTSDNSRSQAFRLDETSNGGYLLRSMSSSDGAGSVLDFNYPSTIVGSGYDPENVRLYSYSSGRAPMQEWLILPVGTNTFKIVSRSDPNLALTAYGSSNGTSNGTTSTSAGNVFVSEYTGTSNQHWKILSGNKYIHATYRNIKNEETFKTSIGSSWVKLFCPITNFGDTVTWTSSNPNAVYISSSSLGISLSIKGVGKVQITATIKSSNGDLVDEYTSTVIAIMENGKYVISNADTYKFASVENSSLSSGANIEQWEYCSGDKFEWLLEYQSDGYYKIKSELSDLYLGVSTSDTSAIVQYSSSSANNNILWLLDTTEQGNIKLVCKASESANKALAVPLSSNADGTNLTQLTYTEDSNYRDEWKMFEYFATLKVNMMADEAYRARYTNYSSKLSNSMSKIQEMYLREFGICIDYSSDISSFTSLGDECDEISGNTYTSGCSHANNDACQRVAFNITGSAEKGVHHKNIYNIMFRIPFPNINNNTLLVFIGHRICTGYDADTGNDEEGPLGLSWIDYGIASITDFGSTEREIETIAHEIGHWYGAPDHYYIEDGPNTAELKASTGYNFNSWCIYGEYKGDSSVMNNLVICEGCRTYIEANRGKFDHS